MPLLARAPLTYAMAAETSVLGTFPLGTYVAKGLSARGVAFLQNKAAIEPSRVKHTISDIIVMAVHGRGSDDEASGQTARPPAGAATMSKSEGRSESRDPVADAAQASGRGRDDRLHETEMAGGRLPGAAQPGAAEPPTIGGQPAAASNPAARYGGARGEGSGAAASDLGQPGRGTGLVPQTGMAAYLVIEPVAEAATAELKLISNFGTTNHKDHALGRRSQCSEGAFIVRKMSLVEDDVFDQAINARKEMQGTAGFRMKKLGRGASIDVNRWDDELRNSSMRCALFYKYAVDTHGALGMGRLLMRHVDGEGAHHPKTIVEVSSYDLSTFRHGGIWSVGIELPEFKRRVAGGLRPLYTGRNELGAVPARHLSTPGGRPLPRLRTLRHLRARLHLSVGVGRADRRT